MCMRGPTLSLGAGKPHSHAGLEAYRDDTTVAALLFTTFLDQNWAHKQVRVSNDSTVSTALFEPHLMILRRPFSCIIGVSLPA